MTELPPVRPTITEYPLHTLTCAQCGAATTAPWPAGVPRGVLGPRLIALVAVCSGGYHLSKRTPAGLLADLCHVSVAVGTITAGEPTASAALAAPVAAAQAYVQQAPVVHADETGWREGRQQAWLWVAGDDAGDGVLDPSPAGGRCRARVARRQCGVLGQ